jgi:chaperonin cofactor prefoldin
MISQRELEGVVNQVNEAIAKLNKRLESLETQQTILLHDIKEFAQKPTKERSKKSGRAD